MEQAIAMWKDAIQSTYAAVGIYGAIALTLAIGMPIVLGVQHIGKRIKNRT